MKKQFLLSLAALVSISGCSLGSPKGDSPSDIDESDVYEVIRRDAYFYYCANRTYPALGDESFPEFTIPYRFGIHNGYYVCYMAYGTYVCGGIGPSTYLPNDSPVDFGDGLVFTLLPCTLFANYIAWKDHHVWLLADAYGLGYLQRNDMEDISNTIDEMWESIRVKVRNW